MNKKLFVIPIFFLLFGCLNPIYYVEVSPEANISSINTIGVFKFVRGSGSVRSRISITVAFENALKENGFDLVRNQEIAEAIEKSIELGTLIRRNLPLENGTFPIDTLEKIRNKIGVDALLLGRIRDAYCISEFSSDGCRVRVDFQLIDTRSGKSIMNGVGFEEGTTLLVAAKKIAINAIQKLKERGNSSK